MSAVRRDREGRGTVEELRKLYPGDVDWMGYKLGEENPATFHHILKREYKGKRILDNGAIIGAASHTYLHFIEKADPDTYDILTDIFFDINRSKKPPTQLHHWLVDKALTEFENEFGEMILERHTILVNNRVQLSDTEYIKEWVTVSREHIIKPHYRESFCSKNIKKDKHRTRKRKGNTRRNKRFG